jgi:hypothetical protein
MYRSKLDAFGVEAYVRNGGWFAPTMWYRPLGGWQVMVPYSDRLSAEECLGMDLVSDEERDAVRGPRQSSRL